MKALTIEEINNRKPKQSRLTAIVFPPTTRGSNGTSVRTVFARCDCGNIKELTPKAIANGYTISCGCAVMDSPVTKGRTLEQMLQDRPKRSRLTPIAFISGRRTAKGRHLMEMKCKCDCGNETILTVQRFFRGTLSCGCLKREVNREFPRKYTKTIPAIRSMYSCMIGRCYNPENKGYSNYGGRGVRVCKEWKNSYQLFLNWVIENGYKKGLQLDKDKLGDGKLYSPKTCCFLTRQENRKYQRPPKSKYRLIYKGIEMGINDISNKFGIPYPTLYKMAKFGHEIKKHKDDLRKV